MFRNGLRLLVHAGQPSCPSALTKTKNMYYDSSTSIIVRYCAQPLFLKNVRVLGRRPNRSLLMDDTTYNFFSPSQTHACMLLFGTDGRHTFDVHTRYAYPRGSSRTSRDLLISLSFFYERGNNFRRFFRQGKGSAKIRNVNCG